MVTGPRQIYIILKIIQKLPTNPLDWRELEKLFNTEKFFFKPTSFFESKFEVITFSKFDLSEKSETIN